MNKDLTGKYILARDHNGDFHSMAYLYQYCGWNLYKVFDSHNGPSIWTVKADEEIYDTLEAVEARKTYLESDDWKDSDERNRLEAERQTKRDKEMQANIQAREDNLRECELAVAESPTEENRATLQDAYGRAAFDDHIPF